MYQHHIMLKTQEPMDNSLVSSWYNTVKEYGPDSVVYKYPYGDGFVGMEYAVTSGDEFVHCYIIPLVRDLTETETQFIVMAWEYIYPQDFDIEISNQYDENPEYEIEIDANVLESAVSDMRKWHHNRWVSEMVAGGWRYGQYFSESQKTHPALRDWDSLPESHRRAPEFTKQQVFEWLRKLL